MSNYRLFMQPKYGEKSPEVVVPAEEVLDLKHPAIWRTKFDAENAASILNDVRYNTCYEPIMTVPVTNALLHTEDGWHMPLRIYHPEGEGPHPVMLFLHGGGFVHNDLSLYDYMLRYICKYSGVLLFAPEYRLAPEYRCPIGREDCYMAYQWVAEHAADYRGDIRSYTLCGDSAGGTLTAGIALMARDRKGPAISKQMLIFPCTTFFLETAPYSEKRYGRGGYMLRIDSTKPGLGDIYFADANDAFDPYNSPLLSDDLTNLPPAVFYSAECDPLLDQGLMYAAKLQDSGIPVEYHIYEGMLHGFTNRAYQKTYECLNQICDDIPKL